MAHREDDRTDPTCEALRTFHVLALYPNGPVAQALLSLYFIEDTEIGVIFFFFKMAQLRKLWSWDTPESLAMELWQ